MTATTLPDPLLIGLVGRGRTGKNSTGSYLMNHHDFLPIAITDPLYSALSELLVDASALNDSRKDHPVHGAQESGRELLQSLGDWTRQHLGQDVLRRHAELTMETANRNRVARDFVITDLRTADEILWVWERGGFIWHVRNSGATPVREHHTEHIEAAIEQASERWALLHPAAAQHHAIGADWILSNSGTLEQLYEQVDQALAALGRREAEAAR